jgi:ribosomal protein L2
VELLWIQYHTHGGGEGKTSVVDLHAAWGILTKGYKTETLVIFTHVFKTRDSRKVLVRL